MISSLSLSFSLSSRITQIARLEAIWFDLASIRKQKEFSILLIKNRAKRVLFLQVAKINKQTTFERMFIVAKKKWISFHRFIYFSIFRDLTFCYMPDANYLSILYIYWLMIIPTGVKTIILIILIILGI